MSRIVITDTDEYGETTRLGWFDPDQSTRLDAGTRWDGNNRVDCATGSQWIDEALYLTLGGRWVLNRDATRYHNGRETYRFLTSDEAREWAIAAELDEETIEQHWPGTPAESGPGPAPIGPAVKVWLPADLLARIDQLATDKGSTRSATIRDLLAQSVR